MGLSKRDIGDAGEELAVKYLRDMGYKIIGRNLVSRYGEIDLVARKKNRLYFVEIRTRLGKCYGSALDSITTSKMAKIRRTAEVLLSKNREWQEMIPFFSVVAIDEDRLGRLKIEFLEDAFQ